MIAFKNNEPRAALDFTASSWHDMQIDQRTLPTPAGDSSLLHFDGAVMQGYSYRSRASEVVFCRAYPQKCKEGRGKQIALESK